MAEVIQNRTTGNRALTVGFGLLALLPFLIARLIPPHMINTGYSVCFFKTVTGLPCPFCGLTHAYVHAAHGDFHGALTYHPFWWIAALIMVVIAVSAFIDGLSGKNTLRVLASFASSAMWPALLAIVCFGLYRIAFSG